MKKRERKEVDRLYEKAKRREEVDRLYEKAKRREEVDRLYEKAKRREEVDRLYEKAKRREEVDDESIFFIRFFGEENDLVHIIGRGKISIYGERENMWNFIRQEYNRYVRSCNNPNLELITDSTSENELDDNAVDTLRHHATISYSDRVLDYEKILEMIDREHPHDEEAIYKTLVLKIHQKIMEIYPFLTYKCIEKITKNSGDLIGGESK